MVDEPVRQAEHKDLFGNTFFTACECFKRLVWLRVILAPQYGLNIRTSHLADDISSDEELAPLVTRRLYMGGNNQGLQMEVQGKDKNKLVFATMVTKQDESSDWRLKNIF